MDVKSTHSHSTYHTASPNFEGPLTFDTNSNNSNNSNSINQTSHYQLISESTRNASTPSQSPNQTMRSVQFNLSEVLLSTGFPTVVQHPNPATTTAINLPAPVSTRIPQPTTSHFHPIRPRSRAPEEGEEVYKYGISKPRGTKFMLAFTLIDVNARPMSKSFETRKGHKWFQNYSTGGKITRKTRNRKRRSASGVGEKLQQRQNIKQFETHVTWRKRFPVAMKKQYQTQASRGCHYHINQHIWFLFSSYK